MGRVVLAGLVVALATVLAVIVERRRPAPPTQSSWTVPQQLDRLDFDSPDTPWLVAVFTSATCDSCRAALDKARVLASADVAVQEVEVSSQRDLHDRYHIDAVPTVVLADKDGVVKASFVGPPGATDLWAAVAEARQPDRRSSDAGREDSAGS